MCQILRLAVSLDIVLAKQLFLELKMACTALFGFIQWIVLLFSRVPLHLCWYFCSIIWDMCRYCHLVFWRVDHCRILLRSTSFERLAILCPLARRCHLIIWILGTSNSNSYRFIFVNGLFILFWQLLVVVHFILSCGVAYVTYLHTQGLQVNLVLTLYLFLIYHHTIK